MEILKFNDIGSQGYRDKKSKFVTKTQVLYLKSNSMKTILGLIVRA